MNEYQRAVDILKSYVDSEGIAVSYTHLDVYKRQDFDILVSYFNEVYPIIDASDNTERDRFDVCFDNWIKQDYWIKIINNIEADLINFSKEEKEFLNTFIAWITDALQHTSVIVVEGNL